MAKKTCPVCGKKIAAEASVCLYCAKELEVDTSLEEAADAVPASHSHKTPWLIITVLSLVIIGVVVVVFFVFPPPDTPATEPTPDLTATTVTTPTRDTARDAWLHTFTGRWYDEDSVGKSDIEVMGGQTLYIHDILNDQVLFDLYSYSGGDTPTTAFIKDTAATLYDDTLHFTFTDDGLGHSGEGYMRFTDDGIQMEVMLDTAPAENEHSLMLNTIFNRSSVPSSEGIDLSQMKTLADVMAVAGRQTADPVTDDKGNTAYTFGVLQVMTDTAGELTELTVDYTESDDKTLYSFNEIDGTMDYETVKTYFGEAVHDYIEQPTDIRVLHYEPAETLSVTFTFDAAEDLLIHIVYRL